jgi:hypothetical protein
VVDETLADCLKQLGDTAAIQGISQQSHCCIDISAAAAAAAGAAKETCWNGKAWSNDNWWANLVCCK